MTTANWILVAVFFATEFLAAVLCGYCIGKTIGGAK